MIERMCCSSKDSILQALKVIDDNAKGILFVIGTDGTFAGTQIGRAHV